jgi:hypothetical protein
MSLTDFPEGLLTGTQLELLNNIQMLQRNAAGTALNLLQADGSDNLVLGSATWNAQTLTGNWAVSGALRPNSDIEATSTSVFYFGDTTTDGSWRIKRDGNDLVFERRESSAWTEKYRITD